MMKKSMIALVATAVMLSSCATSQMGDPNAIGMGAVIGGNFGQAIGGIIGDSNNGPRGGFTGSAIGTIIGTIAGAAIGNAATAPRDENKGVVAYDPVDGQDVYLSNNEYNNSSDRDIVEQPQVNLNIHNIRFIDDNRNHKIDSNENSSIIFNIMNNGDDPVYNVIPLVQLVDGQRKELYISSSVMVEKILPGQGIRYTAVIRGGDKLKDGEATFRVAVTLKGVNKLYDEKEFTLHTSSGAD